MTVEILIGCIIFGIYLVSCFRILYQYSTVRETLSLADDQEVSKRLPTQLISKHLTFIARSQRMVVKYWTIWYPLTVVSGSTYAWFLTSLMIDPTSEWSLIVVIFLTITLTSAIVKGLLYPFPPDWFAEWSLSLALTNNTLMINRVNILIQRTTKEIHSEIVKQYELNKLNIILAHLKEQREIILVSKYEREL